MDGNQSLDLQLGEVLALGPNKNLAQAQNPKYNSLFIFGQICFKQFILYNKLPIYKTLKDKLGLTIFVCQVNLQGLAYSTILRSMLSFLQGYMLVNVSAEKPQRAYGLDDWTQL